MSWRPCWLADKITPILFSTYVWLLVSGVVPGVLLVGPALMAAVVIARRSRLMLWVRFGVRPATATEQATLDAALVVIPSLRGRGQPRLWVGLKGRGFHTIGSRHLLVGRELLAGVSAGRLPAEQLCAAASFALGQAAPTGSGLVDAVGLYCWPWSVVERGAQAVSRFAARVPLLRFAWALRPVVFLLGAVNAYATGPEFWRQVVATSVVAILVMTYTTPVLRRRWLNRLQELGDARVVADGLGGVWAGMLRRASTDHATTRRIELLLAPRALTGPALRSA